MEQKIAQIKLAMSHLTECIIAEIELSQKEEDVKVAKIKAHNDTLLAKEALRELQEN